MSRTLKKTRIKYLPPKVQLRNRDAASGSYPTHLRLASDNRNGDFNTFFDDTKTIMFKSHPRIPGTFSGGQNIGPGFDVLGTYDSYALRNNVILWWRFEAAQDDGFGGIGYADDAYNNHPVTQESNGFSLSTSVPGYYNNERDTFDNHYSLYTLGYKNTDPPISDKYSSEQDETDFAPTQPFGMALHAKIDNIALQAYSPLLWRGDALNQSPDWQFFVTSDGRLCFGVYESSTGDNDIYGTAPGVFTPGIWQHVGVTFNGSTTCVFYLNGEIVANSVLASTSWPQFTAGNRPVYLASARDQYYMGGNFATEGYFDGVVIADRVITKNEMVYLQLGAPIPGDETIQNTEVGAVGVSMPSGLHSQSPFLKRYDATGSLVANEELQSSIVVQAVVRKGIGDTFATFTPGQDLTPFRDDGHPAVDAISVYTAGTENAFYATGSKISDVGEGFDQPLWSKSKIEIDLTPAQSCSFGITNFTSASNNYPMGYWNNVTKTWEGIGSGREFGYYYTASLGALNAFWDQQCIGFTTGLDNGGESIRDYVMGAVTSNFGFPYHPKFHATASNQIDLSDYITQPFLLEKIVLEFSGALGLNTTFVATNSKVSMSTFFILNQRKSFAYNSDNVQTIPYIASGGGNHASFSVTGVQIPSTYNGNYVATSRDLIGWWQVVKFNSTSSNTLSRMTRDLDIVDASASNDWSGRFTLSGTVKNPLPSQGHQEVFLQGTTSFMLQNQNSTRSGLFTPGGRDYLGSLEKGQELASSFISYDNVPVVTLSKYGKINPYVLLPGDALVFGWQVPYYFAFNDNGFVDIYPGIGPVLSFPAKPAKIILYGSLIKEDREFHDTLNQHLTSISVHEVIE